MLLALDVVQQSAELYSGEEVKKYLHLSGSGEDFAIGILLAACRQELEGLLNAAFLTQTLAATYELDMPVTGDITGALYPVETLLELPRPPLQTISKVEIESDVGEWAEISSDLYATQKATPACVQIYPDAFSIWQADWWTDVQRFPQIKITYTSGYTDKKSVPDQYKLWLLNLISARRLNREDASVPAKIARAVASAKVWTL